MFVRQINKQTTKRRTWERETDNNHCSFISELWLASLLHPCQWDEAHRDHLGQLSSALHPKVSTDFFRFPKAHTVACSTQGCYLHILLHLYPEHMNTFDSPHSALWVGSGEGADQCQKVLILHCPPLQSTHFSLEIHRSSKDHRSHTSAVWRISTSEIY